MSTLALQRSCPAVVLDRGRAGPRRFAPASRSTRSASRTCITRCASRTARAASSTRSPTSTCTSPCRTTSRARTCRASSRCCTGTSARSRSSRSATSWSEMTEKLDARVRPHRDGLSLLRHEEGAGVGRREPDGLQGLADRRAARRQAGAVAEGRGRRDQPVPVLEAHLGLRRAQPALAHHDQGARRRPHVARGADRHRRVRKPRARCTASSSAPTRST